MSSIFRVGGVPEHFNYPWHLALEKSHFRQKGDFEVSWKDVSGGTGSMRKKLRENELDLALMLTEGAIQAISEGEDLEIIGTYVSSPLLWGIHVGSESSFEKVGDLEGRRIAISRKGSGSHLMSFVLASQMGWEGRSLDFVEVKNFEGAQKAFDEGRVDVFLWEKFTTKPLVDRGEWRRLEVIPSPWPCFLMVARAGLSHHFPNALLQMMEVLRETRTLLSKNETLAYLHQKYKLEKEDLAEWYSQTHWLCEPVISGRDFSLAQLALHDLGLIDSIRDNSHYLAEICRIS